MIRPLMHELMYGQSPSIIAILVKFAVFWPTIFTDNSEIWHGIVHHKSTLVVFDRTSRFYKFCPAFRWTKRDDKF